MKTSRTWNLGTIVGKLMLGLVLAAMIGSVNVAPALGKDNHKDMGKHDNRRYEQRGHAYGHDRNYGYRADRYYGPYGYRERVYVPPPVVYAPPPPPGIGIFFPPIFIHP